jgi:hypothetical protein
MKNFWFRSFLPLCILVLGAYGQLDAAAHPGSIHHPSLKHSDRLEHTTFDTGKNSLPFFKSFAAAERLKTFIIDGTEVREEEEDEHELSLLRKNRKISNYFTAIFCSLTRGYLLSYIKDTLSFCKHFSDFSSNGRHLIFQVFLI